MRYRVVQKFATRRTLYQVGDAIEVDETRGKILERQHFVVPDDSTGEEPAKTIGSNTIEPKATRERSGAAGLTGPSNAPSGGQTGGDTPQSSSHRGRQRRTRESSEHEAALES